MKKKVFGKLMKELPRIFDSNIVANCETVLSLYVPSSSIFASIFLIFIPEENEIEWFGSQTKNARETACKMVE